MKLCEMYRFSIQMRGGGPCIPAAISMFFCSHACLLKKEIQVAPSIKEISGELGIQSNVLKII